MKKITKLFMLLFIFSSLMVSTVFADTRTWDDIQENHGTSILLNRCIYSAVDRYSGYKRGEILSEGSIEIVNNQNGEIYVNISTLAHKNVDRIRHVLYLDQWNESKQDWVQVDSLNFSRTKEEEENGELSYLMHSITITGYPVNKYYRVRGMHLVEFNGDIETCSTQTHGVLITKN